MSDDVHIPEGSQTEHVRAALSSIAMQLQYMAKAQDDLKRSTEMALANIREDVRNDIGQLRTDLTTQMEKLVTKDSFEPVRNIAYAIVGTFGLGIMGVLLGMAFSAKGVVP